MTRKIINQSAVMTADANLSLFAPEIKQTFTTTLAYNFTVRVISGSLSGQKFKGFFSYNDSLVTGKGSEEIGVKEGLSVNFNFLGRTYTEADDFNSSLYPRVLFENGMLVGLDFEIFTDKFSFQIIRNFGNNSSFFNYFIKDGLTEKTGKGKVIYRVRELPNTSDFCLGTWNTRQKSSSQTHIWSKKKKTRQRKA